MMSNRLAVISVGGNSLIQTGQVGTLPEQFENARMTSREIVKVIASGWRVAITHGNGPQVGNLLLRSDLAKRYGNMPVIPLDICGADTQGAIGYMLQQGLRNELDKACIQTSVITLVTQVLIDRNDPAFSNPTKPIGPFFKKEDAEHYRSQEGWNIAEDSNRGYRRVVPSPKPKEIVELTSIKSLIELGCVVIAAGGGGIPVARDENGYLRGVEAVVDKDYSSSVLASTLQADLLLISTSVDKVALNYNRPNQKNLDHVTLNQAKMYLEQGHFAPGSMKPKVQAIVEYLENGGNEAIITSASKLALALSGKAGTRFTAN
jgi:carbamate kinase